MDKCRHSPARREGTLWSCTKCDELFGKEPDTKKCTKCNGQLQTEVCVYWACLDCGFVIGRSAQNL